MIGPFEALLHSLGSVFQLQLHVDHKNACSIKLGSDLIIQLQPDPSQEHLWVFAQLTLIPPGRFREQVLMEALKANGKPDPLPGILTYLAEPNQLALFQTYPMNLLTGENLASFIGAFIETAESWREAVSHGRSAP
jgi:hypothetical protein